MNEIIKPQLKYSVDYIALHNAREKISYAKINTIKLKDKIVKVYLNSSILCGISDYTLFKLIEYSIIKKHKTLLNNGYLVNGTTITNWLKGTTPYIIISDTIIKLLSAIKQIESSLDNSGKALIVVDGSKHFFTKDVIDAINYVYIPSVIDLKDSTLSNALDICNNSILNADLFKNKDLNCGNRTVLVHGNYALHCDLDYALINVPTIRIIAKTSDSILKKSSTYVQNTKYNEYIKSQKIDCKYAVILRNY